MLKILQLVAIVAAIEFCRANYLYDDTNHYIDVKNKLATELGCLDPCPDPLKNPEYLLPHENCSHYCRCDHYTVHKMDCPATLHFSNETKNCNYPNSANCSGGIYFKIETDYPPNLPPVSVDNDNFIPTDVTPIKTSTTVRTTTTPIATTTPISTTTPITITSPISTTTPIATTTPIVTTTPITITSPISTTTPIATTTPISTTTPIATTSPIATKTPIETTTPKFCTRRQCPETDVPGVITRFATDSDNSMYCECRNGIPFIKMCPPESIFSETVMRCFKNTSTNPVLPCQPPFSSGTGTINPAPTQPPTQYNPTSSQPIPTQPSTQYNPTTSQPISTTSFALGEIIGDATTTETSSSATSLNGETTTFSTNPAAVSETTTAFTETGAPTPTNLPCIPRENFPTRGDVPSTAICPPADAETSATSPTCPCPLEKYLQNDDEVFQFEQI